MLVQIFNSLQNDLRDAKGANQNLIIESKLKTKHHEFYAGIHLMKETPYIRVVLEEAEPFPTRLPSCNGFKVRLTEVKGKYGTPLANLMIIGKENCQNEFHLLVMQDIITFAESIDVNGEMVKGVIERLNQWSDYFDRCYDTLFTMEANLQKGLYGELHFLEKLLKYENSIEVITAWRGPEKQSHDFKFPVVHYEVKTLTIDQCERVTINGMSQITPPTEKELFLYIGKVDVNDHTGETLQDIVHRIESTLKGNKEAITCFWEKLFKMNYPKSGIENALYFHEHLILERWYHIPREMSQIKHEPCLRFKNPDFYPYVFEQSYPESITNEIAALQYLGKYKEMA